MSINFTPNKNTYKDLGQFRFWCQKVLPLVYDDSLSYYELLCKVVNYLNDTIQNVDLMGDDMQKLYTAYVQLQVWVNDYFDSLDVQNEINNKLNVMSTDGSLSALIKPLFDEYKVAIDDTVDLQNDMIANIRGLVEANNEVVEGEIDVLTARMDTFTKLGAGSTTGDAELMDIRVGSDGKTYGSAGEAVRQQLSVRNMKCQKVTKLPAVELPLEEVKRTIETKGAEVISCIPESYTILVDEVANLSNDIEDVKAKLSEPTRNIFKATFKPHSNLDNSSGKYSVYNDGSGNPNTVATEEYIEVESNTDYVLSHGSAKIYDTFFCEYGEDKAFIGIVGCSINAGGVTARTSANTKYIRIKMNESGKTEELASLTNLQLEVGTVKTEYITPFITKLENGYVTEDKLAENSVTTNKVSDCSITEKKLSIFTQTKNIFSGFTSGYWMDSKYNKPTAIPTTDSSVNRYAVTLDKMKVLPEQNYAFTKPSEFYGFVYEYDENDDFIVRTNIVNGKVLITNSRTHYIRVQESCPDINTICDDVKYQIENGTKQTAYERPKVIDKYISEELKRNVCKDETLTTIKTQLDNIRSTIIKRNSETKFINFGFCTDTHLENTDGDQSGIIDIKTLSQIGHENWIDFIVHGGDIFNSYENGDTNGSQGITLDDALTRIDNALSEFNTNVPIYIARGNHDVNVKYRPNYPDETVDYEQKLTQTQFKMLCQNKWAKCVDSSHKCSFYKDYDNEKVRVIVLDVYGNDTQSPNFDSELLNWLCNTALMLESKRDYSVIIFAHTIEGAINNIMNNVISAFKNGIKYNSGANVTADFSKQGACDFIGVICGHSHADVATSNNGYWNIQSDTSYKKYSDIVSSNIYANIYTIDTVNHILYKQKLGTNGDSCAFDWVNLTYTNLTV